MGRLTEYFGRGSASSSTFVNVEVNEERVDWQAKALASLSVNSPEARKRIRAAIRKELRLAKQRISKDARGALADDPRKAYMAVKYSLYKQVLGGNVSILSRKKAGAKYELQRERKLDKNPKQRGGNRRTRSGTTKRIDTYYGPDRGFILRFVNSGTDERHIKFGANAKRNGNRGSIAHRGWFEMSAAWQMDTAEKNIAEMIEEELAAVYGEEMGE